MAVKPSPRKKYGAEPRRAPKPPVPGYIWLLTGCALSAFVMFLWQLSNSPPKLAAPSAPKQAEPVVANPQAPARVAAAKPETPEKTAEPEKAAPSEDLASQKPRYDFYRLLKENRASTPRAETAKTAAGNPASNTEQNDTNYILQVASYKTPDDAEQLRAKLLLLNLDAKSENVTLRNGEVWHRVLIGPLKNHTELTRVRSILSDNKYDALVLKTNKAATAP